MGKSAKQLLGIPSRASAGVLGPQLKTGGKSAAQPGIPSGEMGVTGGPASDFQAGGKWAPQGQPMPPGIDPRAVAANPTGFAQWQQGAQQQESAMPGSTALAPQGQSSPMSTAIAGRPSYAQRVGLARDRNAAARATMQPQPVSGPKGVAQPRGMQPASGRKGVAQPTMQSMQVRPSQDQRRMVQMLRGRNGVM